MPRKTDTKKSTPGRRAPETPIAPPADLSTGTVLERMTDAFLAFDTARRVTYANAAAGRIFERRPRDLLGQEIGTCLGEDAGPAFEQALTKAAAQGVAVRDVVYCAQREVWLEVLAYPDTSGFSVYFRDISGIKRAEQALRESEVNLRRVEALSKTGTWRLDMQRNELQWPDENYEIFGLPKGAPLTFEALLATIQPKDKDAAGRSLQAGPRGGIFDFERRITVDGETKWVRERAELEFDAEGHLLGGVGTTLDITDQKRAEQELIESRAQLASVVESAMDAVIAVDAEQRIVLFNAAAEAAFRYPAAEVIGKPLDMLIPERFRKAHAGHVQRFAATGVTTRAMGRLGTLTGLRAGGEEFPIEVSIAQAEANGHQLFSVILRDITERQQAEERQRLLTAELDHRVKNVLANVSAVARMSSRGAKSVPDFAEALTGRLQAMAAAHTMLQHGHWDGASLADLIGQVLGPFRAPAANIRIEGEPITVNAKATQLLALVLHELATNAVKYGALSVPDGRVSVGWWRVDARSKPAHVRLVWRESGGPPVRSPQAKGFGLSVLQHMVGHELGASVNCAFLPRGLEYTLEGPFESSGPIQRTAATGTNWLPRAAGPHATPESRRVLIVEDDAMVALALKALLESQGHSVAGPAASLEQALALIQNEQIDAALLDFGLADGNAIKAAELLRKRKIPFAFTTGFGLETLPEPLRTVPRLAKPYRDKDVQALIATLTAG